MTRDAMETKDKCRTWRGDVASQRALLLSADLAALNTLAFGYPRKHRHNRNNTALLARHGMFGAVRVADTSKKPICIPLCLEAD